jgi:hypothetical protein
VYADLKKAGWLAANYRHAKIEARHAAADSF